MFPKSIHLYSQELKSVPDYNIMRKDRVMNKDWTGNSNSIYKTLGASSHCEHERQVDDYYATEPKAVEILLENETFNNRVWECACGEGHISKVLESHSYDVSSTDLIYRGYGEEEPYDFLKCDEQNIDEDIITNPPYKYAKEFVEKALDVVASGRKVAMFLKLTFLEGQARRQMFEKYPPKTIYVFSGRVKCAMNGDFEKVGSSAVAYAWFVWEKGFKGDPVVKWVN